MPKRTSPADRPRRRSRAESGASASGHRPSDATVKMVIVTLDDHLAGATQRTNAALARERVPVTVTQHAASSFDDAAALARCHEDIADADLIVCTMLFMDPHIDAVISALTARREACDAMVCCMSAPRVMQLTRMGGFTMDGEAGGALGFLKKLRPKPKPGQSASAGAQQVAMLKRLPQILRFIPGKAQDVRAWFLTLQYWLAGSEENLGQMVRFLASRYADGPRRALRGSISSRPPIDYPETGVYHPRMKCRIGAEAQSLPGARRGGGGPRVGLLLMRSYLLAGNTAHYDAVIAALEDRGMSVVPMFASGLDARPAIDAYCHDENGNASIDALVSLTGFSLVGGPAYNDSDAAAELLARLDVPYVAAHALEFQSMDDWQASERGLSPVEATMMVAIPELDGATGPMVFGGRTGGSLDEDRDMAAQEERAEMLARRVAKLVRLRESERHERRIGIVIFNFPPGSGATGTAAYLGVFESLLNTLRHLSQEGYDVEVPDDVEAVRRAILEGNAARYGTDANVLAQISVDDHVAREVHLEAIEAQWGPAPGRDLTDGHHLHLLGARFGNVVVAVQPSFGYEGDPMRLLFEHGFAPTHAFSAFYRYLREDFDAHALLHFGTHGALEFMPGKQVGLSADCWPDRLIGDAPNFYLYASNNPSEAAIAKRRSAATLISYLTPPVTRSGLYRDLLDLRASIDRWRGLEEGSERSELGALIQAQAVTATLRDEGASWHADQREREIDALRHEILEIEQTLIPDGLHVIGKPPAEAARRELLGLLAETSAPAGVPEQALAALLRGADELDVRAAWPHLPAEADAALPALVRTARLLGEDHELPGLVHALDARFVAPAPGGDLLRTPDVLPTGRNVHGFDPFRIPSAHALASGARQAVQLIERFREDGGAAPETVALVLWGTDNLKNEGGPIGQALALIGARPRFDAYGRLSGAELVPLEVLGRPRVDVVMTTSGIFRDLLPLQTRLLAEAALLAAEADEPLEKNAVRRHALAFAAEHKCDLATAALRVFSNADGAYGANVNLLLESGAWGEAEELADAYTKRKCFAYGADGQAAAQPELLGSILSGVDLAYQNLESVDLGVTTIDHYFDTLGGISLAAQQASGREDVPVYIGDQTRGEDRVRTLSEQVALETRTRALNPRWYEAMLEHGYEGVRQIEAQVTNTLGWSATTGQVDAWVYGRLSETFVLDDAMRERLSALNPTASLKLAERLVEASERNYWSPDAEMLDALRDACEELEDRLEGVVGASEASADTSTHAAVRGEIALA